MHPTSFALWIWYRGGRYRGFQSQPVGPTVQDELKASLRQLGITAVPNPAGRTDLGVHARMQVVSFRTRLNLSAAQLDAHLAATLPSDVGVCATRTTPRAFHAQWRCVGKEYRYRIALREPPESWQPYVWNLSRAREFVGLTSPGLKQQLERCVGTRDFSAFHGHASKRRERTLQSVDVAALATGEGELLDVRLRGDAFGKYQVRYLVGAAVAAAVGLLPEERLLAALSEGSSLQGYRAPAEGLTLWEVLYPPELDPFAPEREAPARLPPAPPFS